MAMNDSLEFVTTYGLEDEKTTVTHKEHKRKISVDPPYTPQPLYYGLLSDTLPQIPSPAIEATKHERRLTFFGALKLYPKAILWAAAISFGIIMEGFGTALLNSFYVFPEFQQEFGVRTPEGKYEIPTNWQAALSNISGVTSIIGILINGTLIERFGYKKSTLACLVSLSLAILPVFFGRTLQLLLVGQLLCGLAWGGISTLCITYASEVLPTNLRGYCTAAINMCWLFGQIIAQGTLRAFIDWPNEWSYRIPFALQWVFIFVTIMFALAAPDSPWWLVQKNRPDDAKKSLIRLTRKHGNFNIDHCIAMMIHTDEVEKSLAKNRTGTTWFECFRGTNLRRTEIACMVFMIQNASGLPMIGFAPYFYNKVGFNETQSFNIAVGMYGTAVLAGLISLWTMRYVGRRTLYLYGLVGQFVILMIAGTLACFRESPGTLWAQAAMVIVFIFVFDLTIGPMTYSLVAELPSTRLRVKTVALSRIAYNINGQITNVLQTNMLNTLSWNWRGKSCFFWAGSCFLCFIYCFFRLPETRGLTYLELDLLFEKKAHATKFTQVQRQLSECGYFCMDDDELGRPRWVEERTGRVARQGSTASAAVLEECPC